MKEPTTLRRAASISPSQFFPIQFAAVFLALICVTTSTARAAGPAFSIDTLSSWSGVSGITGFEDVPGGANRTMGETFRINEGNAQVTSINFVLYDYYGGGLSHFQVGVAAWGGSRPTGSFLYLSDPINSAGVGWQSFSVTPNNLQLTQGQQYV